jgi:hypothetical protein
MKDDIYPNAEAKEIEENAKRNSLGFFMKQYKKGDFVYTITKKPFQKRTIACMHLPTKTIFGYSELWQDWNKMGHWEDYD